MPISATCPSCHRALKAKDEYAGKRVQCPACKAAIVLPAVDLPELNDDFLIPPPTSSLPKSPHPVRRAAAGAQHAESPWYRRQWHWLAVAGVLLLSLWPKVGVGVAAIALLVGAVMGLIGGIVPILRIFMGAPGTVLLMIFSRSARFEMMRAPEDHPYKVLVRSAGKPTRGLLWRGVLLMATFIPAMFLQGFATELFRHRQVAEANPNGPALPEHLQLPQHHPAALGRAGHPPEPAAPQNAAGDHDALAAPGPQFGGPRPFGPGRLPQGRPATEGQNGNEPLFYVLLTYGDYAGAASPTALVRQVFAPSPGFVEDSISGDETNRTVTFQHRGQLDFARYGRALSQGGLRSFRLQHSTQPFE